MAKKKVPRKKGRPPKFQSGTMFAMRLEEADLRLLEEAAAAAGKTVSDWAREKLLAAAKRQKPKA